MPDIISILIAERDKLNRAIEALQGAARRGRPKGTDTTSAPKGPRRRKRMSAAARKAASERMKAYWAARAKAKGKKVSK